MHIDLVSLTLIARGAFNSFVHMHLVVEPLIGSLQVVTKTKSIRKFSSKTKPYFLHMVSDSNIRKGFAACLSKVNRKMWQIDCKYKANNNRLLWENIIFQVIALFSTSYWHSPRSMSHCIVIEGTLLGKKSMSRQLSVKIIWKKGQAQHSFLCCLTPVINCTHAASLEERERVRARLPSYPPPRFNYSIGEVRSTCTACFLNRQQQQKIIKTMFFFLSWEITRDDDGFPFSRPNCVPTSSFPY